jgi:hypothetical protein
MLRRNPCGSDTVLAREADLLALAGVQGASHLKVGTTDRFHNVVKIPARAPADPPLPPLVRTCVMSAVPLVSLLFLRSSRMAMAPASACGKLPPPCFIPRQT